MRFIKFITCCFFALFFLKAEAQDPRFSQFYAAPLHTNPAMTGVFPGQFRIVGNYRNQWSSILGGSAFNTYAASFEGRNRVFRGDYIAYGLDFLRDDAGDSRFNRTKADIGISYLKKLGGSPYATNDQYLVLGVQAGMGQNGIDWSRLSFSTQFDNVNEQYVPGSATGENFGNDSRIYTDFNVGLLYYALFGENTSIYGGFAMHHINQPDISFYDGSTDPLYTRITGQLGGEIGFNDNFSILPAVLVLVQGPSFENVIGANFRYTNRDMNEVAIRAGAWFRMVKNNESPIGSEAMIFTTMLEMERFLLGLSYDVNVSSLSDATNSRGAFEISVAYIHPEESRYRVKCPKF